MPDQVKLWEQFHVDDAEYFGEDDAGVYFDAVEFEGEWFALALVDAEHFVEPLPFAGPFLTHDEGKMRAAAMAYDWCGDNDCLTAQNYHRFMRLCGLG